MFQVINYLFVYIKNPLIKNINTPLISSQVPIINNQMVITDNILNNYIIQNEGFKFGLFTFLFSVLLDNTFSKNLLVKLKKKSKNLYNENLKKNFINLILLSPIYYLISYNFLNKSNILNIYHVISILSIQSILFYFSHKAMHKINYLKKFHNFHHKFNKYILPSSSHGVSIIEYTFSYMLPLFLACVLLRPSIKSFSYSIKIIGISNIMIHCEGLMDLKLPKYLVSPSKHIDHHKINKGNYSAPFLNSEMLID